MKNLIRFHTFAGAFFEPPLAFGFTTSVTLAGEERKEQERIPNSAHISTIHENTGKAMTIRY